MTTKLSRKLLKGFSLMELLVYLAVMTLLTVVIMNTLVKTSQFGRSAVGKEGIVRSAIVLFNRVNKQIKSAEEVSLSNGNLVLGGVTFNANQSIETGVSLENLVFSLTEAATTTKVTTTFSIGGTTFSSVSVLRHKE